jgi:arylsulfatase A-like enzyme
MKSILTIFLFAFGIATGPAIGTSSAADRPNVLFLAVDDMNDWIGCLEGTAPFEGPRAITPNLDKLAERGVNFTNAHTAGVFCAPSRAAIFSGQYASTTGCYESAYYFVNRPELEGLQTSFAKAGYTTLGAGKLFHHPVGAIDQRDWTEFFLRSREQRENGWDIDSWNEATPFPKPFPASPYNEGEEIKGGLFLEWAGLPDEQEEEMADSIRVNWAVEQLQKNHENPFFLACGIYAPHYPHYCPQKYFDLYDRDEIELPAYRADDLADLPPKIAKQYSHRIKIRQKLEDLDALKDSIHGYLACISYADAMMGRVLDALEASPHADNTVVVLWSDHGYHLGEKNWGKHTLWERTSNVPFLWAGPGVAKGVKSDVTVSLIDMYPTFVEMCGLPKPRQELEGTSLAATLKNPANAGDRNVYLPHMRPGEFAIINRDWRYIRYGDDGEELYHVQKDPHEWNNLAEDPANAERMKEMRGDAPETFAAPERKFQSKKDLVIDRETYRWEKDEGNYTPPPKYLPYTNSLPVKSGPDSKRDLGANLVLDGSFEEAPGKQSRWRFAPGTYGRSTERYTDGDHSLASQKFAEKGNVARQLITIEPGQSYEASYQIFFESGSEGKVVFDTLDRFDDTAQVVMEATDGGKWHSFSRRFQSGEHREVTLRFFPARNFGGRFFVDDVQLRALPGKPATEPAKADLEAKPKQAASGKKGGNGKNVLFIVCDDLNTHVSPSGYDSILTPTLAQFATEAMTFQRAFCQYPVCGPSRASFLNGLYPESSGVLDNTADIRTTRPGTVSMPQFFKENGYWTGSVGKVFHSPRHEHGEIAWNEFHRFENDELPVVTEARKKFETEHGSIEEGKNRKLWKEVEKEAKSKLDAQTPPGYGRSGLTDAQHKDGRNARQVAQWLQERPNGDQPFFIACGIQKPHVPFLAPDKYFDLYPLEEITYTPDRANLWDSLPKTAISKRYEAFGFELGKENDTLRREYMQAYHACISFIDAQLQLVFDALKESGQWEDTIVIFTSDHGYHLGDHFLWGKVTLFDIGAKVPFLIRAPGLTEGGTTSEAMVELIDIYPTLAQLTGLTPPDHLQGTSLRPLLDHPERTGKKKYAYSVVSRGDKLGYALRNQRWRYGLWPDGEELYNLTNDPEEKNNLAGKEHVTGQIEELRMALAEKREEAASRP